jgi:hypothetical protein
MEQDMPQVQYTAAGAKVDSIRGVGLHWTPGQVRYVTSEVAERLLHFRDTWEKVDGEAVNDDPIGLAEEDKSVEEPIPVVDFHGMDKDVLAEFAQRNYNQKLDKRQSREALRQKVVALFSQHELDK